MVYIVVIETMCGCLEPITDQVGVNSNAPLMASSFSIKKSGSAQILTNNGY